MNKSNFLIIFSLFLFSCAEFKDIFERGAIKENVASNQSIRYVYHTVQSGDTFNSIGKYYRGKPSEIKRLNGYEESQKPVVADELIVPTSRKKFGKVVPKEQKSQPAEQVQKKPEVKVAKKQYIWPVEGRLSSTYGKRGGKMHDGIDVSAPSGTPVIASRTGTVIHAGKLSGYGNLVVIKHSDDYFTAYAHLTKIHVKKGRAIKQGQKLGTVGNTGRSRGPHLHFEIRHQTKPLDPLNFLPKKK